MSSSAPRNRLRLIRLAQITAVITVVSATVAGAVVAFGVADRTVVRVNQVGYVSGESKKAFVMSSGSLAHAGFELVDTRGTVVKSGTLSEPTGGWNTTFTTVRSADFSDLNAPGTYDLKLTGGATAPSTTVHIGTARQILAPLVEKNVAFFQAQRDGADVVPSAMGRAPSHLNDRGATVYAPPSFNDDATRLTGGLHAVDGGPVDVEGGWFDAGDFLKFTHTSSYSTAALLLAERADNAAGVRTPGLGAEAAHGVAWLSKMWNADSGVLLAQVGTGVGDNSITSDHDVWRLPESDDQTSAAAGDPHWWLAHRPVFPANDVGKPVPPNLAGRVAAAFALRAQTAGDLTQARRWLDQAASVYAAADVSAQPRLVTAYPAAFYPKASYLDDMEFGATELALAARRLSDSRKADWQNDAARYAQGYLDSDAKGTLGVGDVSALAHADLISLGDPISPKLVGDLERQLRTGVARAERDPFNAGAVYTEFDSVPHTFGLATTATLYRRVTGETRYSAFGAQQRSWALGANAWGTSFMVGAGAVFPHCPEHQVANLAGRGDLIGAVVNGPNDAGKLNELNSFDTMKKCSSSPQSPWRDFDGRGSRYLDEVGAWQTVEPSIDFTSTALLSFSLASAQDAQAQLAAVHVAGKPAELLVGTEKELPAVNLARVGRQRHHHDCVRRVRLRRLAWLCGSHGSTLLNRAR